MNLSRFLTALGINAVPAIGWFAADWTVGTTLVVYWLETVISSLFIAVRVLAHRRRVRVRGHFRYEPRENARQNGAGISFLKHFLPITLSFSGVHGIFLFALVFVLTANGHGAEVSLNFESIALGCGLIFAFQCMDLLIDLFRMSSLPFRWMENMAERNLGRVIIVHLTIIFGMLVGGLTGGTRGFFLVFVVLKTMNDLSMVFPQYDPEEAPRWLCWLMDKVPNVGKTQSFSDFWMEGKRDEKARRAKNERPMPK